MHEIPPGTDYSPKDVPTASPKPAYHLSPHHPPPLPHHYSSPTNPLIISFILTLAASKLLGSGPLGNSNPFSCGLLPRSVSILSGIGFPILSSVSRTTHKNSHPNRNPQERQRGEGTILAKITPIPHTPPSIVITAKRLLDRRAAARPAETSGPVIEEFAFVAVKFLLSHKNNNILAVQCQK